MKKILAIVAALFVGFSSMNAQCLPDSMVVYTPEDVEIFNDYVSKFSSRKELSMNQLMLETGFYFLGTPYVSYTLEVAQPEKLIVNLRQLDCTTFTETCLALARTIKSSCQPTFDEYVCELCKIRYRYGNLVDFTSRLHYFSDWIYDNDQMFIVKNMTQELGGQEFPLYVNVMTRLRKNYRQLKDNDVFYAEIDSLQKIISDREYFYIPKAQIDSVDVQEGDIMAMTVSGKGLGIMHMGIAVRKYDQLYFMHASSVGKEVMITELPFSEYLANIKSNTGCMVLRPLEPIE